MKNIFSEKCQIVGLMMLPFLFSKILKQPAKTSVTGKNWNPDQTTVLDSFILYITVTAIFT